MQPTQERRKELAGYLVAEVMRIESDLEALGAKELAEMAATISARLDEMSNGPNQQQMHLEGV